MGFASFLRLLAAALCLAACASMDNDAADAGVADTTMDGGDPYDEARVMFSGHSLINLNSPYFFAQLAEAGGQRVSYQAQIGNGSTMSLRLSCPRSGQQADGEPLSFRVLQELARPGAYDVLVLTERHDIVLTLAYEDSTSMAKHFYDSALDGNPAARPFLYESWWNLDRTAPESWLDRVARERTAWDCLASRVNAERREGEPALRVLPAATALRALVAQVLHGGVPDMTTLDDVFVDEVHLTPNANYFIALFDYAVIYERSPLGLPHTLQPMYGTAPSMSAATAASLQQLAWRQAQAAIAESDGHLQSPGACEAALASLCAQTPDTGAYTCDTALPAAYRTVDSPIRAVSETWCLQ